MANEMLRVVDDICLTCDNCLQEADFAISAKETTNGELRLCEKCFKELTSNIYKISMPRSIG